MGLLVVVVLQFMVEILAGALNYNLQAQEIRG